MGESLSAVLFSFRCIRDAGPENRFFDEKKEAQSFWDDLSSRYHPDCRTAATLQRSNKRLALITGLPFFLTVKQVQEITQA